MENFWKFGKILFVCSFLEATLDFDYPLKKSGTEPINLGFFIKINNFMKKMDDLSQKTIMITKKIPPKIVKKDLCSNYSKKSGRIAFNLKIFIKIINSMKKIND